MHSILFVSIAFPPKSDAEGLQVAKYLKYLLREGHDQIAVDAVTSRMPTLNMTYDAALDHAAYGVRQKVELPIFENKYTNFILRKLAPWMVHQPDSKYSFHWQSGMARRLIKHPPDLIYSRSFPMSSAVMAYKLKRHYNVPWVMHLSDAWADSPLAHATGRSMKYNQKLERMCFESADAVCVTSESTRAFYQRKYKHLAQRIVFFPNVFDSEDIVPLDNPGIHHGTKLRIVHTGSLTANRSPEPFLRALFNLPIEKQNEIEVVFAGEVDRKNKRILDRYKSASLAHLGPVPYKTALELQRSADVLLLLDMPVEQPELRLFFPSKTLDYMIAGKPITALIDDGSELQSAFQKHGLGTCIVRHDTDGIRDHLLWLLSSRTTNYFESRRPAGEYEASYNAGRLLNLFKALLRRQ